MPPHPELSGQTLLQVTIILASAVSLYMRLNSARLPLSAWLQLWLCIGSHLAGFSSPDQPQRDRNNTCCLAACRTAGEMVHGPADKLPPFHHHQPRVLLWVFGVSAEAAFYKAYTYIRLQHRQEEKKALSHNMEQKRSLNSAGGDDCWLSNGNCSINSPPLT